MKHILLHIPQKFKIPEAIELTPFCECVTSRGVFLRETLFAFETELFGVESIFELSPRMLVEVFIAGLKFSFWRYITIMT